MSPKAKFVKKAAIKKKAAVTKKSVQKSVATKKRVTKKKVVHPQVSPRVRYEMIATMAYYRAEERNFEQGHDYQDWLDCEEIVDQMLNK